MTDILFDDTILEESDTEYSEELNNVIKFIERFQRPDTIELFNTTESYWFAIILTNRFGGTIYFKHYPAHWCTKILDRYFDILGELNNIDEYEIWR